MRDSAQIDAMCAQAQRFLIDHAAATGRDTAGLRMEVRRLFAEIAAFCALPCGGAK